MDFVAYVWNDRGDSGKISCLEGIRNKGVVRGNCNTRLWGIPDGILLADIVQRLVFQFPKLAMRVRLPLSAPLK